MQVFEEGLQALANQLSLSANCIQLPKKIHYLGIAYSGGVDSSVLLSLCKQSTLMQLLCQQNFKLQIIHINHQIQSANTTWQQHALLQAKHYQLPCFTYCVDGLQYAGQLGLEASARKARYQKLIQHAQIYLKQENTTYTYLLGHHANDQLETFLLQWFRSAGLDGLVCMPTHQKRQNIGFLRPLLKLNKQILVDYAHFNQLKYVIDPSNNCLDYERNKIRQQLMPNLLSENFNQLNNPYNQTQNMLQSIDYLQESKALLDDLIDEKIITLQAKPQTIKIGIFKQLINMQTLFNWDLSNWLTMQKNNPRQASYCLRKQLQKINIYLSKEHFLELIAQINTIDFKKKHYLQCSLKLAQHSPWLTSSSNQLNQYYDLIVHQQTIQCLPIDAWQQAILKFNETILLAHHKSIQKNQTLILSTIQEQTIVALSHNFANTIAQYLNPILNHLFRQIFEKVYTHYQKTLDDFCLQALQAYIQQNMMSIFEKILAKKHLNIDSASNIEKKIIIDWQASTQKHKFIWKNQQQSLKNYWQTYSVLPVFRNQFVLSLTIHIDNQQKNYIIWQFHHFIECFYKNHINNEINH